VQAAPADSLGGANVDAKTLNPCRYSPSRSNEAPRGCCCCYRLLHERMLLARAVLKPKNKPATLRVTIITAVEVTSDHSQSFVTDTDAAYLRKETSEFRQSFKVCYLRSGLGLLLPTLR